MTTYRVVHTESGKTGVFSEEGMLPALLEIVGGGYTEAQVAMAMVLRAELSDGEQVRTANFVITPLIGEEKESAK